MVKYIPKLKVDRRLGRFSNGVSNDYRIGHAINDAGHFWKFDADGKIRMLIRITYSDITDIHVDLEGNEKYMYRILGGDHREW